MDTNSGGSQEKPSVEEAGAKGGKAAAAKMTREERRERAKRAAEARWNAGVAQAICGSPDRPLVISGVSIQAYVLEDGTRVLTQGDFQEALGRHRKANGRYEDGEEPTPPILQGERINPFISKELMEKSRPIKFRTPQGTMASGYRAEILPAVCEVFLKARDAGVLQKQQAHIAVRADILIRGLASVGIIALVDAATGYQDLRAKNALAEILEAYIAKEIRKWVSTFPANFYKEMFRLRNVPYNGTLKRPQYIGHLTNDLVYARLAPGVLKELRNKNPVTENGRRRAKHPPWLSDYGHPELKAHLKAVVALMRPSKTWEQFYDMLQTSLPKYQDLPLLDWVEENRVG